MKAFLAILFLASLAPAVWADGATLYKWTDAQGVIHYSDKPPVEKAADLQAMDMPSFPAQDPAQIAAHQAQLDVEAQAAQKLLQTELDEEAQAKALAAQQAQLDAELAAIQQQAVSQPAAQPIYITSAFVPRIYRANLFVPHHYAGPHTSRPVSSLPAVSILQKPH